MRKLMAICLAMLMVLSMCSFSVMAEGEVDFAEIANGQPVNFVTADLSIGGCTITSSDENVIALDGTVTRPLFEDKTVQITIDGGEAIDVTVKAQTVEALYVNDFSTDVGEGWDIQVKGINTPSSIVDGKFNVVIGATHVGETNQGRTNVTYTMPSEIDYTKPVSIKFDVDNFTDIASSGADIRPSGGVYNSDGTSYKAFPASSFARVNSASGFSSSYFAAGKDIDFKYDPLTGEIWTLATGTLSSKTLVEFAGADGIPEGGYVKITGFSFCNASDNCTATFDIDNFVVYQEVSEEEVLANATPAQQALYYAKYLEEDYVSNGGSFAALTADLKFATDEDLVAGASIAWESSDEAVIAADGTVTRPFFETKTVTITGTVSVNGAEDIVKEYTVTVLPLSMTSASEIVDAENLEVGSFVGADGWTSSIKTWERMDVAQDADGNKFFSICASAYQPAGTSPQYTFQSFPTALASGETLVFEAKVRVPEKKGLANWGLLLNGKEMAEFIYYNQYLYDNDYDLGSDGYYGASAARSDKNITANTWYKIKFEIYANAESATGYSVKCYIDDKLVGTHRTLNAVPAEITSAKFQFTGRSNMDSTDDAKVTTPVYFFDTDDVQVYTTQSVDSVVASLDDAGKVNFFKALIEATEIPANVTAGQDLGLVASYEDYDLASLGVNITWETSDDTYIGENGVVKTLAPIGTTKNVTVTATIEAGLEEATASVDVTLKDGIVLVKEVNFDDLEDSALGGAQVIADGTGKALYMANAEAKHKSSGTIANVQGGGRGDRLILEADVKYVHGDNETCSGVFRVLTYAGKAGINVGLNYNTRKVSLSTTTAEASGDAKGIIVNQNKTVSYDMPASVAQKGEGEWVKITIDHNPLSQTYQVYVDGVLINKVPILQAQMDLGSNGGAAIRGYSLELSLEGEMWVDNVSLKKYENTNAVEVNAALNAALVLYASPEYRSVLTNGEFTPMTIGKSTISGSAYVRDLNGTGEGETPSIKIENPSTYKFVTDGPTLTYAINGEEVTALNVDKAGIVDLTITAEKNGIVDSYTVERKVAPVAIRSLALGTASCLNGMWLEGATGTEKVIVVQCLANGKPAYSYTPATDETEEYEWFGTQVFDLAELANAEEDKSYNPETGILKGVAVPHPGVSDTITEVRIFVMGANGIMPVAHRGGLLDW